MDSVGAGVRHDVYSLHGFAKRALRDGGEGVARHMGSTGRTAPPPKRTKAERRAHAQRELVRAAVEIVAEQGVAAATFQAIGERSGYHRSLVTQHFGNRTGLINAILDYLHEHGGQLMAQAHLDDLPSLEALLMFIDVLLKEIRRNREMRAYFMLLSSAVADLDPVLTAYAAQHDRIRQRVQSLVERGQAENTIHRSIDSNALALMVGCQVLGLSIQLIVNPDLDVEAVRTLARASVRNQIGG